MELNGTITENRVDLDGTISAKKTLSGSLSRPGRPITVDDALSDTSENPVQNKVVTAALGNKLSTTGDAYRSASIPMGHLDSTSTATVMTAQVDGITELRDGVCMWLRNGVITSASGFTLNVNGLGAKPCYSSAAAASRSTTIFNVNYTMLFVYNEDRVDGGCWDIVYGVDTNTTYTPPKLGFGYGTCTTAAATVAKIASISSYTLVAGGIVAIKFDNDVPAGATLNISSKGAKAIYYKGASITAGVIKAGDTVTMIYSTYYHVLSIDRGGSDITIDNALSATSENPVQNKVVKAALDAKGTYSKPSGGIPASDLASGVIPTIPTKTSDLNNDSGFVNAAGAAAAAPVQSVNGQTGAVTVQAATDAQVSTAVNTWCGNNIAQETGYVLDRTLTMSNAAAPADKVGELKSAINKLTPAATDADVGKALIVKTVVDGKPTEYEYGEAGGSSADILVHGKNFFDGVWTEGYLVNQANGQLEEGTSYKVTDYIQIEPSTAYTISSYYGSSYNINGLRYAVYDENKDFISGAASTPTFTSEANAKYVRLSLLKALINAQLEEGTTYTSYEQYEEYLDPALVWSPAIEENVEQKIASTPLSVTPKDTTFFVPSPNLFNPSTAVENELVNQTTGVFQTATGYTRSGYIPIEGGKPYSFVSLNGSINHYLRYAFYKANKTFIRGAYGMLSEIDHVDAPTDAAYIAVAVLTTLMPYMVAQADTIPSYYPYEYTYINPEYIVSEQANDIIVNIPQKIYATEGIELNLYFEDLTEDWERYTWNIDCPVGRQMARGYNLTPASEQAGTYTLSITAKTKDGVTKQVNASLIVTSKTAGDGESVSILILGDSTTANGIAVSKINENFTGDGMTVSMLGTLGTAPNNHEGRSGWTFAQYFNTASGNAFYNPSTNTFDASYYFSSTGIAKPDWFIINLGINDTFNYTSDSGLDTAISTIIGLCNSMIASVKSASPNSKIGICLTIPPNHSQDAFGKAYACNQTRDRYKRNNALWVQKQIEEYDGRESEGIYLIPIHTNLDTINNMGMETLPVNTRNTAVTYQSPIANGGVHPVESGYWQIADVYTAFLKAQAN